MAKSNKIESPSAQSVYINNYPNGLIHPRASHRPNLFNSVSFKLNETWASFALPLSMAKQATKRNGEEISDYSNLFLGQSDRTRKVYVRDGQNFRCIEMTNQQILDAIQADRAIYKAEHV